MRILIAAEALLLLFPVSLIYAAMALVAVGGYLDGGGGIGGKLAAGLLLLLPGYALAALWWLVFSYRKLTLGEIPKTAWVGLAAGALLCLLLLWLPASLLPTLNGSNATAFFAMFAVIGGPLVVCITVLAEIRRQSSQQGATRQPPFIK